jgi:dTMP kinase
LVALEGDNCAGKSSLVQLLKDGPFEMEYFKFPDYDANSATEEFLADYLASETKPEEQVVHLMFTANRWENVRTMTRWVYTGTTVLCDRYSYSGVAYSVARGLDLQWCKRVEAGLPKPDVVIYLKVSPEERLRRGALVDFRGPKYNPEIARVYEEELADSSWHTIDTTAMTRAQVCSAAVEILRQAMEAFQGGDLEGVFTPGVLHVDPVYFERNNVVRFYSAMPKWWVVFLFLTMLSLF